MKKDSIFGRFLVQCSAAGASIGVLQALAGYFPRLDVLIVVVSAALVGGVAGIVLGLILYPLFSDSSTEFLALRAVAVVSGLLGILFSLFVRWWTRGEGAVVSMFITPLIAVILALTIKLYLSFTHAKKSAENDCTRPSS